MRKVVRKGDLCSGHGAHPARGCIEASPDVFVNGKPVHRVGDKWATHTDGNDTHDAVLLEGANGVYVNGRPIAMTGCEISCGSETEQGSDDVLVYHSPASPKPLITETTDEWHPQTNFSRRWERSATTSSKFRLISSISKTSSAHGISRPMKSLMTTYLIKGGAVSPTVYSTNGVRKTAREWITSCIFGLVSFQESISSS